MLVERVSKGKFVEGPAQSFLARNEFVIRRLHSLSGLIPVGAYMVIHLMTNASVLESAGAFQRNVYMIHSLGSLLPVVEWVFIFLPFLFHAVVGVVIVAGGLPNTGNYPYASNIRYTLQRATGMIAFFFIMWHVFHMHGWFHGEWWTTQVAEPLGGHQFRPYNAASSAGLALQNILYVLLYALGILSCVFHLANGIWTMGITWGVWTSPAAQKRASWVCTVFGIGLGIVGMAALGGMQDMGEGEPLEQAIEVEDRMYQHKLDSGEIVDTPEKRSGSHEEPSDDEQESVSQLPHKRPS